MLQPLMIIIAMPQPTVIDVRMLEGGSGGRKPIHRNWKRSNQSLWLARIKGSLNIWIFKQPLHNPQKFPKNGSAPKKSKKILNLKPLMGLEQTGVKYLNVCSTPPQNIKASALIGKCSHFDAVFQKNINPVMF